MNTNNCSVCKCCDVWCQCKTRIKKIEPKRCGLCKDEFMTLARFGNHKDGYCINCWEIIRKMGF